jgi:hypothetical protein
MLSYFCLPLIWTRSAVKERIETLIDLVSLYLFPIRDHIVVDPLKQTFTAMFFAVYFLYRVEGASIHEGMHTYISPACRSYLW